MLYITKIYLIIKDWNISTTTYLHPKNIITCIINATTKNYLLISKTNTNK